MKRNIQIYVEGVKLDLFDDENIEVNSTIQNIQDISKVFSDFSQSFTIPATKNNNTIFHHWYNNEVYSYSGVQFDVNQRKSAKIDINLTPFRSGKIQLEKVNLVKGKPESYQLTFYGDITSLKDKFLEENLTDLDLSSLDHNYTGTEVINRITDDTTPLLLDYKDGDTTNHRLDNIQLLCLNCYYMQTGNPYNKDKEQYWNYNLLE